MATDTLSQLRTGQLAGAVRLDLSAGLTDFPREILDLAGSLEVLNLSNNRLASLPEDLPRLKKLRIVFLSQNDFTHVPPVLGECSGLSMIGLKSNRITEVDGRAFPKTLRWLILTDNQVATLPGELGGCPALQKLMLAGNRLKSLPDSMEACRNLELIRLAANEFEKLPEWLWRLPRLAWLALAGNPCSPGHGTGTGAAAIPEVPWAGLSLEGRLGEGASGVIHRAQWGGADGDADAAGRQAVAVKVFKGAVTSDGLPSSEMAAWMAAGEHPNLISVRGRVTGHPDGADALVMPLVPSGFRSLAAPPSLESCTRDVYSEGFRPELPAVLELAAGFASAARHLHGRGILHGDFYGHNILWNGEGAGVLGDFGAASLYSPDNSPAARALERIEVRAFGCLLEELLAHVHRRAGQERILKALEELRGDCLYEEPAARPSFAEIGDRLRGITSSPSGTVSV